MPLPSSPALASNPDARHVLRFTADDVAQALDAARASLALSRAEVCNLSISTVGRLVEGVLRVRRLRRGRRRRPRRPSGRTAGRAVIPRRACLGPVVKPDGKRRLFLVGAADEPDALVRVLNVVTVLQARLRRLEAEPAEDGLSIRLEIDDPGDHTRRGAGATAGSLPGGHPTGLRLAGRSCAVRDVA